MGSNLGICRAVLWGRRGTEPRLLKKPKLLSRESQETEKQLWEHCRAPGSGSAPPGSSPEAERAPAGGRSRQSHPGTGQTQRLSVVTRFGFLCRWGAKSGEVIRCSLNYQALLTSVAVIRIACVICLCTDFSQDPVLAVLCLFPTHTTECFRFCMDSSNTSHGSAAGLLFPLQNVSLYQKKKEQNQTNQKRKQYFAVLGICGTVAALLRLERQESWCCC